MHRLRTLSTPALIAAVIAIDIALWTSVLPFEIWAHNAASAPHPSRDVLFGILAVNALFLLGMAMASAFTMELVRRGVSLGRFVRRFAPLKVRARL